jgi:hypothetical protein
MIELKFIERVVSRMLSDNSGTRIKGLHPE